MARMNNRSFILLSNNEISEHSVAYVKIVDADEKVVRVRGRSVQGLKIIHHNTSYRL